MMEDRYVVREQVYASQGKRFANFLIDKGIFYALLLILGFFLGLIAE